SYQSISVGTRKSYRTYHIGLHLHTTTSSRNLRYLSLDEMAATYAFLELTSPNHTSISKKPPNVSKGPENSSRSFGDATSASLVTSGKKNKRRRRGNATKASLSAPQSAPQSKSLNPAAITFTPAHFHIGNVTGYIPTTKADNTDKRSILPVNSESTVTEKTDPPKKKRNRRRKVAKNEDVAHLNPSRECHHVPTQDQQDDNMAKPQEVQSSKNKSPRKRGRARKRGIGHPDVQGCSEKRAENHTGNAHANGTNEKKASEKVDHQHLISNGDGMARQSQDEGAQVQKSEAHKEHQDTKHRLLNQRKKLLAQLAKVDTALAALEIAAPTRQESGNGKNGNSNGNISRTSARVNSNAPDNAHPTNGPAEPAQNSRGCIAHWTHSDCRYGNSSS
ncbi:hypothetical protein BDV97DRAFT_407200, partial [Delphinella strobiligena]